MLGKIFGRKKSAFEEDPTQKVAALDRAIEEARSKSPIVHLKIGAEELVQRLLIDMKTERGVHIESLLGVLGSLAGFCSIDSILKQVTAMNRSAGGCGIADVETIDGGHYYFGTRSMSCSPVLTCPSGL